MLELVGERSKALLAYKRLIYVLDGLAEGINDGELHDYMGSEQIGIEYWRAAREAVRLLCERNRKHEARLVIQKAVNYYSHQAETGDINILLELLIDEQLLDEALEVIRQHCSAQFKATEASEITYDPICGQLKLVTAVNLPVSMPLEIYSKLAIILLQLNANHLVDDVAKTIMNEDSEEFGDLMLDVAEAYMGKDMFDYSLPFLEKLVKSENYNKAAVWLMYGESLYRAGNRLEEAKAAYQKVVALGKRYRFHPIYGPIDTPPLIGDPLAKIDIYQLLYFKLPNITKLEKSFLQF